MFTPSTPLRSAQRPAPPFVDEESLGKPLGEQDDHGNTFGAVKFHGYYSRGPAWRDNFARSLCTRASLQIRPPSSGETSWPRQNGQVQFRHARISFSVSAFSKSTYLKTAELLYRYGSI